MRSRRTKAERREGAVERISSYSYETSKAKRKGIPEDTWEQKRKEHLEILLSKH